MISRCQSKDEANADLNKVTSADTVVLWVWIWAAGVVLNSANS